MAELYADQKTLIGRETYRFLCRIREEHPEAWAKVQARAAEIEQRENKEASTCPS